MKKRIPFLLLMSGLLITVVLVARFRLQQNEELTEVTEFKVRFMLAKDLIAKLEAQLEKPTDGSLISEDVAIGLLRSEIYQLLRARQFGELDDLANHLRTTNLRLPNNWSLLAVFYNAVDGFPVTSWDKHLASLDEWIQLRPQSVTPFVCKGRAYINYAWVARGSGWANSVTPTGWLLFGLRLKDAAKAFDEAEQISGTETELHAARVMLAKGQGWPREQMEKSFKRAVDLDPTYYDVYDRKADYLLDRWYGEKGDVVRFARSATDDTPDGDPTLFGRIINGVAWGYGGSELRWHPRDSGPDAIRWDELKASHEKLIEQYPDSMAAHLTHCWHAVARFERPLVRTLTERLGKNFDPSSMVNRWVYPTWWEWARATNSPVEIFRLTNTKMDAAVTSFTAPFIDEGKRVAVGCADGNVVIMDAETLKKLTVLKCGGQPVGSLAVSPDGRMLAAGSVTYQGSSEGGGVWLWNWENRRLVKELPVAGFVHSVAFAPDGKSIVASGGKHTAVSQLSRIKLPEIAIDTAQWDAELKPGCVRFSPDGKVGIYGWGGTLGVFSDHPMNNINELYNEPRLESIINDAAFTRDSRHLVVGTARDFVAAYSMETGELGVFDTTSWQVQQPASPKEFGGILSLAFSADEKHLFTGGVDCAISVWEFPALKRVFVMPGHLNEVISLTVSPDGNRLLSASRDFSVIMWDISKLNQGAGVR